MIGTLLLALLLTAKVEYNNTVIINKLLIVRICHVGKKLAGAGMGNITLLISMYNSLSIYDFCITSFAMNLPNIFFNVHFYLFHKNPLR